MIKKTKLFGLNIKKKKKVFNGKYSVLVIIFFESNSSSFNLALLLRTKKILYQKNSNSASVEKIRLLTETNITLKQELFGIEIREIVNEIGITFFEKKQKIKKNLIFKQCKNLISCKLYILKKSIKKINEVEIEVAIERTLSKIEKIINYVSVAKICIEQKTEDMNLL